MFSGWLVLFAIFIVFLCFLPRLIAWIQYRRWLVETIDKIPGPHAIPILGNTYQFKWSRTAFTEQMIAWGRQYFLNGLTRFWIGPMPVIIVSRNETIKEIMENSKFLTKAPQYNSLRPWLGDGLLLSTGQKWFNRRRMITPAYHFNILNGFVPIFDRESRILIDNLEKFADTDKEVDLFEHLKRLALDIICETSMGVNLHAQTEDSDYVHAVQKITQLIWTRERMPLLWWTPIWYALGYGFQYDRALNLLIGFTRQTIQKRSKELAANGNVNHNTVTANGLGDAAKRLPLLDSLLSMQKEYKLTDEDIREEVDTFMFEGHDTTSSGMGWALWLLGRFPHIQEKIFQELDEVFGNSDRPVQPEDLKQLKYLERCIKEAMRQYPPVPIFGRRIMEDTMLDGYLLPKGVSVMIALGAAHNNPIAFADPAEFNPDNFLPERIAARHPYDYIPFSAGQKFALMEEKTVLANVFRHYRIVTNATDWTDNIPIPELILKPSEGFRVKLYKRIQGT